MQSTKLVIRYLLALRSMVKPARATASCFVGLVVVGQYTLVVRTGAKSFA
ncbi:MAG: hypothetical protein ACI8R9_001158 [Paraglaciecola sp.]|jgi:hypothetical protein